MGKMMKKYIVRLLSLLVFWGLQFNHKAHAFNPDTLLEVQMGSKIKMIDSGISNEFGIDLFYLKTTTLKKF